MAAMAAMASSAAVVASGFRSTGFASRQLAMASIGKRSAADQVARKAMEVRAGTASLSELEKTVKQAISAASRSHLMKQASFLAFNALMVMPALAEEIEKEPNSDFDFNLTLPIIAVQFLLLMVALDNTWFKPIASASHALAAPTLRASPAASARRSVVVSAAHDAQPSPKLAISRRQAAVTSLTALSVLLLSYPAHARDIPLFGLKKAKKLSDQVVQEVKELVKEGEGAISGAVAEFPGAALPNIPSVSEEGLSPVVQAGTVAGAGVIGVLVASTLVNSLVSPAK